MIIRAKRLFIIHVHLSKKSPKSQAMKLKFVFISVLTIQLCSCSLSGEKKTTGDEIYSQSFIKEKMLEVFRWQIGHPVDLNAEQEQWARSVFYSGIMYAYQTTSDPVYLEQTKKWADGWDWKRGRRFRHADDLACGQAYLDVYKVESDPKMLWGIQQAVDSLIADPKPGRVDWWWCDALYMEPPVLARLADITGDTKYYEYLQDMYWDSTDFLYSKEDSLFFRDKRYFNALTANGQKVFWGRGNAWVIGGLAQLLSLVPKNNPIYKDYQELYIQMMTKIASVQQPDGLWRASLLDPDEVPVKETSSSTFFTFAMIWGINNGLLPQDTYLPKVRRAWTALLDCIDENGKLGYVQAIGASPENVKASDNQEYGSGAFLMAASEMYKFAEREK
mgnify:FL=1